MQQKDYILREIEKISVMIMGLLSKMVKRSKENKVLDEKEFKDISQSMLSEGNFNIEAFLNIEEDQFDSYFKLDHGFDSKNTELIGDFLAMMAEIALFEQKKLYLTKAKQIYSYIDLTTKTFSVDRVTKMNNLEIRLENLSL